MCGGAPGVFALLGVDLCLTLEQALTLARQWDGPGVPGQMLGTLLWLAAAVSNTVSLVVAEQRAVASGGGEVGHLSGFVAGIGCFALLRFGASSPLLRDFLPLGWFGPRRAVATGTGQTLGRGGRTLGGAGGRAGRALGGGGGNVRP